MLDYSDSAGIATKNTKGLRKMNDNYFGKISKEDMDYLQRKISAAGEMKTAIKRLLEDEKSTYGANGMTVSWFSQKRIRELRKSMENYLNVG